MAEDKTTLQDFENICRETYDEARTHLVGDFEFNPDGLVKMFEEKPDECQKFFGELVGGPVDVTDEGAITVVLEAGIQPENMAQVMMFIYENFKGEEEEKTVETPTETSETVPLKKRRGRIPTDWSNREIPFGEGTAMHFLFKELLTFDGSFKEFRTYIETAIVGAGVKCKNVYVLLYNTINHAKTRVGYNIVEVDGKIKVSKE